MPVEEVLGLLFELIASLFYFAMIFFGVEVILLENEVNGVIWGGIDFG
ncbi:MAG: hypothetical protein ACLFRG_12730 [Desulfococcaceae bacterium]